MRPRPAAATVGPLLAALVVAAAVASSPAGAAQQPRSLDAACPERVGSAGFVDTAGSVHRRAIDCVAYWAVARGHDDRRFVPAQVVTRGQAASFVVRLLEEAGTTLHEPSNDTFSDDDGSVHERSIERLAAAGVVRGHDADRFAPGAPMTRAQGAALVVRAYALRARQDGAPPLPAGPDAFPDDDGAVLEDDIDAAAHAGIVGGDASGRYHPGVGIHRAAFASVLARTLDALVEAGLAQVPDEPAEPSPEPTAEPTAEPTPPTPAVTVVAAGDIACNHAQPVTPAECQHAATAALVRDIDPDAVVIPGDIQYDDGSVEEFTTEGGWTGTWSAFHDRTWPAPGNHEWHTEGAAGYRHVFDGRTGGSFWYSGDVGAWHLVSLDSDCNEVGGCHDGSPQHEWFESDLAAADGRPTLVFWHHPRFSDGPHGDHEPVADLWRTAVADRDVQLVLYGHDHAYERFAPRDADGAPSDQGLRSIVVGTGGRSLYCDRPPSRHAEVLGCSSHGVLRLELHEDSYAWEFVRATGDFSDAGSSPLRSQE